MKRKLAMACAAAAMLIGGAAQAQSWGDRGGWNTYDNGWGNRGGWGNRWDRDGYDGRGRQVCSGQRGYQLQNKLRHEWNEGEINPRTAQRIDRELNKLQYKAREECGERDWGAVRGIAERYDRIENWINREAHGGWNRREGW